MSISGSQSIGLLRFHHLSGKKSGNSHQFLPSSCDPNGLLFAVTITRLKFSILGSPVCLCTEMKRRKKKPLPWVFEICCLHQFSCVLWGFRTIKWGIKGKCQRLDRRAVRHVAGISSAFPSALTAPNYVGWDRLQNKAKPHKHLTHLRVWVCLLRSDLPWD